MMLADRDRARGRRNAADQGARLLAGERDHRFDLSVLWEAFGARQIECATRFIEAVIPLPAAAQPFSHAMLVTQEERRRVYQRAVVFGRFDLEPPDHRPRE